MDENIKRSLADRLDDGIEVIGVPDGHFERCRWLIENASRHSLILDVGCADGFMFRDKDLDVVEVDIIYRFPRQYRRKIKFVKADAHHLPFKDKSFPGVVLGDVLEHVHHPIQVLREAKRVASNIYMTVPNEYEWDEAKRPFQFAPHVRFYDLETLNQHLKEALRDGFRIIKIRGGGWSFFAASYSTEVDEEKGKVGI